MVEGKLGQTKREEMGAMLKRRALLTCGGLLALVGCSPVRVINALVPRDGYRVETVKYGADPRAAMDVYTPDGARNAPVVVFVYGGSWRTGDRADYRFVGQALASIGCVAVVIDYRLYPQVQYPGFIEDAAAAVAWTAREIAAYGGDPQRLFVMGHSAGAYNAAMVALDDRWLARAHASNAVVKGWIGLAGPYEFLPITGADLKPVFNWPDTPRDSQPIAHVSKRSPPALLLAAEHDSLVDPNRNTRSLADALRAAGAKVDTKVYADLDHFTLVGALAAPLRSHFEGRVLDDIDRWLRSV